MADSFSKVLVKDDRIGNLTDTVAYGVLKGGQSITSTKFMSTSASTSSMVFNIQVPSETTIIDRLVMLEATITLKVSGGKSNAAAQKCIYDYGGTTALAPFPLHSLMNNISVTINNNTITNNIRDILPAFLKMIDPQELQKYSGSTPTALDIMADYPATALTGILNANTSSFIAPSYNGRGAFPVEVAKDDAFTTEQEGKDATNDRIPAYVRFTVREPVLCSPFIFGHNQTNNSGMYGVHNMVFQVNFGSANRVFRTGIVSPYQVEFYKIENASLNFKFLTAHPSDLLSARCCVPYYEIPRYVYQYPTVDHFKATTSAVIGLKSTPAKMALTFNSISLNQIPDKLMIFVRSPLSDQTSKSADRFFPITNISINFNNTAGLCSSMTQHDLWTASVESGSKQSFLEFTGCMMVGAAGGAGDNENMYRPTCGSVLCLSFGKHIPITEDYYAPGSTGSFVLQFTLNLENYGLTNVDQVEVVCCTINSGFLQLERGSSTIYTSLLSKQDVLETSQQEYHAQSDVHRMIGHGFLDRLRSTIGKINPKQIYDTAKNVYGTVKKYSPLIKQGLRMTGDSTAGQIADGMETIGLGYSGGSSKLLKRLK